MSNEASSEDEITLQTAGPVDRRILVISGLAVLSAIIVGAVAQGLLALIRLITNISFFGRFSIAASSPANHHLGFWVLLIPIAGGIVVGFMARYGSKAIRGHGIPEAMEQILTNKSKVPPRLTLLKPISAAIAIGTGGPFGAEGPIIATGGAFGSLVGQLTKTTAVERKILLAAGAAAGMAATFGSPVSAVILAIELLLFEFHPRSIIPVALASAAAAGVRIAFVGSVPMFPMPAIAAPSSMGLIGYTLIGALVGYLSVWATRAVYAIEDAFDKYLPVHWMWAPALGAVAVGIFGYLDPHTLGVGYENITNTLTGTTVGRAALSLCVLKFLSWSISLGSGTSGGTLAPLFTVGGGVGSCLAALGAWLFPGSGLDPRIGALVGMAAFFTGASRALLASVVFALETTWRPIGFLPLLAGCTSSYLVSCLMMPYTIMTEKIARRGVRVPEGYAADFLAQLHVREVAKQPVDTLSADCTIAEARARLKDSKHQSFPVIDKEGSLVGVVTHRDILNGSHRSNQTLRQAIRRPAITVFNDDSLREAINLMAREEVGRLPVVRRADPKKLVGILTRSDILAAEARRLTDHHLAEQSLSFLGLAL